MNNELEQIIIDNQNLIYSITHYFEGYKNKEDLFQVGVLGLIKAYKKFDSSLGVKFTTYAYTYILGEMRKYVREDKGIKISRDITKLNLKIEKASVLLAQKLMREPSIQEISDFLEIPSELISESLQAINVIQSIDEPINMSGKEITLHDTISDNSKIDINTLIALKQELEHLTPFERDLIENRYLKDLTQTETADILGMSQVQVSRKETKVLTKLRDKLAS